VNAISNIKKSFWTWKLSDHDAVIRFLKSADHLNNNMADLELTGIDVKNLTNRYHRPKIIREMEAEFRINIWEPQAPTNTEMNSIFTDWYEPSFEPNLPSQQPPKKLWNFTGPWSRVRPAGTSSMLKQVTLK
jgi:hypothetical protein